MTQLSQEEVLRALEPYRVKKSGSGYRSQCPAHKGNGRSGQNLVITFKDGKALFACHSHQCSYEAIIEALRLEPSPRSLSEQKTSHENSRLVEYHTLDRDGRLVATHKRKVLPNGKKAEVLGWYRNGKPGLANLPTKDLPLYGSQLIKGFNPALPVDICEGQPATEALLSVMAQAIGTYGTGNEPTKEALSWVKGFTLRLWPDNDPVNEKTGLIPGVEHMRAVAKVALEAGATKVILLDTRSLPEKGDAVEWLEAQRGLGEGQELVAKLKGEEVPGLPVLEMLPVAPKARILPRTHAEFMALVPTPQESICGEWFPTSALVMVSGDSGVGKTWFCLDLALSVSCGVPFMGRWSVPKARKVLLVSGEERLQDLQHRIPALLRAKSKAAGRALDPLLTYLVARDRALLPKGLPNLGTPEGRALVEDGLEGVELVILDNYSVLFNGVDENDAKEFAPIQDWLFSLSARGIAVLLVAHTGKNGDHRGSSKKVDGLNASIILNHPSHWKAKDGASFSLQFKKSRDAFGSEVDSFAAKLGKDEQGALCWLFDETPPATQASAKPSPKTAAILELHAQGKTIKEIRASGYTTAMVYKVLSALKNSPTKDTGASRVDSILLSTNPPTGDVSSRIESRPTPKSPDSTHSTHSTIIPSVESRIESRPTPKSPDSTPSTEVNAPKATLPVTQQPDPERDCSKALYPPSNPNAKTATPTKTVAPTNGPKRGGLLLAELREDFHCEVWLDDRGKPFFEYHDGYEPKQREIDFFLSRRGEIVAALQEEQGTTSAPPEKRTGVSF